MLLVAEKADTSSTDVVKRVVVISLRLRLLTPSSVLLRLIHKGLTEHTYVKKITDSVSSTTAKAFKTLETSRNCLCSVYSTHINNVPVFSTAKAKTHL